MFDPGSARYGNFINYYSFNPPEKRLSLIPDNLLNELKLSGNVFALDVGCNSGELTYGLLNHFKGVCNMRILGIDLDSVCIERSIENNPDTDHLDFKVANITSKEDRCSIIKAYLEKQNVKKFDIIFVFSVTMWIHLIGGDESLKDVLKYISSIAHHILLEPQSWKSYKSAVRRSKRLNCEPFQEFDALQWREDVGNDMCKFLTSECSMQILKHFGRTEWGRDLYLLRSSDLLE